jgi:hypothetical protein
MAQVNLTGFGYNESVDKSANYTLTAADSGKVINVTASCTITLPAVAAGVSSVKAIIRVAAPGITVTISPNSADKIVGNGFTAADDKDMIFTDQPAGSFVELLSANEATTDSAWTVQRISGTATREA